jgi:hypothetical protein
VFAPGAGLAPKDFQHLAEAAQVRSVCGGWGGGGWWGSFSGCTGGKAKGRGGYGVWFV